MLESACNGAGKLLVVSGYSGIGKSSLIREVHGPLAAHRGYFASGKFDQLDRSMPYAGLVEALRHLMRQLLSEPESQVQRWRNHILGELGTNASVMVSDPGTDPLGGVCSDECDKWKMDLAVTEEWQQFTIPFTALKQGGWGTPAGTDQIDATKLYSIQFQVGIAPEFDLYIDDLGFYN